MWLKNLISMKPHQQGIHNPLLATDDKGQQRLDGPWCGNWGMCVGLSSPWRLVFQPSAAVGGPSSQFRHPLTSPLNAGSIHLSRLGAWLYIDGGVYKVRQAYDCPAGLKIDLSHDKSNLSLTDDPNWIADKLRKTSLKTSALNITRKRTGGREVIGPFHIGWYFES